MKRIGIDARPLIGTKPTGIGMYLINILKYLSQTNTTDKFYLYSNKPINPELKFGSNFIVKLIPGKIGTLWLRYKLPKFIKSDNLDTFWGTQHILPKKVKGVRYILTVHDLALLINRRWGTRVNAFMQNTFLPKSVKDAQSIIAVSESTKNDLINICKVNANKIQVVYEAASIETEYDVVDIQSALGITEKYILYIGTLEPRKNIETIVKGFEVVAEKCQNLSLVLAGGIGWKSDKLLKYIDDSPYKSRIILPGYIDKTDKINMLLQAEALIFVSHYEGFGIPVLEAFGYGCPVITARNSSLPEVGGDAAIYIENENDAIDLAKKIEYIVNCSQVEKQQIHNRILVQSKKFSWDECARKTLNILMECKV